LLEAGTLALMMEDAKQALQMFSISERIMQDMKLALEHPERFEKFEHFVVRKWVDLDPSMEFRGFVFDNKLNALSQYNHLAFFQHVVDEASDIVASINEFFYNIVLTRLKDKFQKYIVDFALVPSTNPTEKYKIWVIELNPFLPTTDGALFSWERERNVLENGPFEFRYNKKASNGARVMMNHAWRELLDMHVP